MNKTLNYAQLVTTANSLPKLLLAAAVNDWLQLYISTCNRYQLDAV
jgi:hypothetical protein